MWPVTCLRIWLASYLHDRISTVRLSILPAITSSEFPVALGVSKWSHLGSLLFGLFINDFCDRLNDCDFVLYADDLKPFKPIMDSSSYEIIQRNLVFVNEWCKENDMKRSTGARSIRHCC